MEKDLVFNELYKKRAMLQEKVRPQRYRLEKDPLNKVLSCAVKKYDSDIEALTRVLKMYN